MCLQSRSALYGFALVAILALSPARAAENLFDNGSAIDNAGTLGGTGFSNNELTLWQVFDNFSFTRDASIESAWFQMAGGTEPFKFSVYADDAGKPGAEIFSATLDFGKYAFDNFTLYRNGALPPDAGYDFNFDLDSPLTLAPGDYWVSFWGIGSSMFYTLGTGSGDGFIQKRLDTGALITRQGNTPFRLIGRPVDESLAVIDIKPGSDNNPINPRSNGVIPVAVLGSIDFDALQVDFSTVVFGPNQAAPAHNGHVEDVDGDAFMDMVFHFRTRESGIACGDTEAILNGETFGGESFSGADSITTVGCPDAGPGAMDAGDASDADASGSSSDAAAVDWALLLALGLLALPGFQRRRISRR